MRKDNESYIKKLKLLLSETIKVSYIFIFILIKLSELNLFIINK